MAHDLLYFSYCMDQLFKGRVPLIDALQICLEQIPKLPLSKVLSSVKEGGSFSESLSLHPKFFDRLLIHYVRLSEYTGKNYFETIYQYLQFKSSIRGALKKALIYPFFVLIFVLILLWSLNQFLLPELLLFLEEQKKGASLSTQTLVFFLSKGPLIFTVGFAFFVWWFSALSRCIKTPLIGRLFMDYEMALFYKSCGLFLKEKVPLEKALYWSVDGLQVRSLKNSMLEELSRLNHGSALHQVLPYDKTFIKMAEEYGFLQNGFETLSAMRMQKLEMRLEKLTKLIEPMIMVILGGVILLIVLAVWSPIYAMAI